MVSTTTFTTFTTLNFSSTSTNSKMLLLFTLLFTLLSPTLLTSTSAQSHSLPSNCTADTDCPAHSICHFANASCACGLGTTLVSTQNGTSASAVCAVVPCTSDADCTARFGGHVICFKASQAGNVTLTSSFCGCHEPIWSLDHDSQQCLAGRVLLLDIFTGALVVFAAIGAFAVVWIVLRAICCLKRGEYFELQEME